MSHRALTFGQGPGADVILSGDPYMSSVHCRITQIGMAWWVEDMGSTNGTWVHGPGGRRTRIRGKYQLAAGEQVVIGRTVLPWEAR